MIRPNEIKSMAKLSEIRKKSWLFSVSKKPIQDWEGVQNRPREMWNVEASCNWRLLPTNTCFLFYIHSGVMLMWLCVRIRFILHRQRYTDRCCYPIIIMGTQFSHQSNGNACKSLSSLLLLSFHSQPHKSTAFSLFLMPVNSPNLNNNNQLITYVCMSLLQAG